jgi:hypothetical protein
MPYFRHLFLNLELLGNTRKLSLLVVRGVFADTKKGAGGKELNPQTE